MKHEMTAREFLYQAKRMCKSYYRPEPAGPDCSSCDFLDYCNEPQYLPSNVDVCIAVVEQWAKEHPEGKRKTYAEDFLEKFLNTKIYKEENRPGFCRKEIYEGKSGYCAGYARGECCACWNEEMEDTDDTDE